MNKFQNRINARSIALGLPLFLLVVWVLIPTNYIFGAKGPSHSEVSITLSPNGLAGGMIIPACGESYPDSSFNEFYDNTSAPTSGQGTTGTYESTSQDNTNTYSPTAAENPQSSAQHMYYCRVSDHTCVQTRGSYPNAGSCQNSLQTFLPGQTSGMCYAGIASCQANCTSTTPPTTWSPPTITTTNLPNAVVGAPYQVNISATGGFGSYSWSMIYGSLPPGVSLQHLNCIDGPCQVPIYISGIPTVTGIYTFTMQVSVDGLTANRTFTISSSN